jgi:hypothetical protein
MGIAVGPHTAVDVHPPSSRGMIARMSTALPPRAKHIPSSSTSAKSPARAGFIHLAPNTIHSPGVDRERALCGVSVSRSQVRETVMDWSDPSACPRCVEVRKDQAATVKSYSGPNGEWDYSVSPGVVPVMFL